MKATFLTALMICLALGTAVSQDASTSNRKIPPCLNRKKVIALGFSSLNQKELRKHLETAENYLPADGLVIHLDVTAEVDGKPFKAFRHSVFKGVTWKREWFKEAEEDLKAIHPRQFTDNFLYIATTGYHSNLFDDTTWASICNNAGILAAIAKECGLKGIFFDIEHYNGDNVWPAFKYDTECGKTFEECEQQARKRGREMMTAIATEYPDITMVAVLGSYSINFPALNSLDVKARLKDELYGLSPAFFDGMFEVLPPQGKLYDGTEFPGYMADCAED